MTDLCNRCAYLFKECRPLLGARCPMPKATEAPEERGEPFDIPHTVKLPAAGAAIVVKSGDAWLCPILVKDFYEGRP
jgi:hypothetical protein